MDADVPQTIKYAESRFTRVPIDCVQFVGMGLCPVTGDPMPILTEGGGGYPKQGGENGTEQEELTTFQHDMSMILGYLDFASNSESVGFAEVQEIVRDFTGNNLTGTPRLVLGEMHYSEYNPMVGPIMEILTGKRIGVVEERLDWTVTDADPTNVYSQLGLQSAWNYYNNSEEFENLGKGLWRYRNIDYVVVSPENLQEIEDAINVLEQTGVDVLVVNFGTGHIFPDIVGFGKATNGWYAGTVCHEFMNATEAIIGSQGDSDVQEPIIFKDVSYNILIGDIYNLYEGILNNSTASNGSIESVLDQYEVYLDKLVEEIENQQVVEGFYRHTNLGSNVFFFNNTSIAEVLEARTYFKLLREIYPEIKDVKIGKFYGPNTYLRVLPFRPIDDSGKLKVSFAWYKYLKGGDPLLQGYVFPNGGSIEVVFDPENEAILELDDYQW